MHAPEESDQAILPMNQLNNEEFSSAEVGEGRAWAKEKIVRSNTSPAQSGKRVSQGLSGVRQAAKARKQERFTALLHHVTVDWFRDGVYRECPRNLTKKLEYCTLGAPQDRVSPDQVVGRL